MRAHLSINVSNVSESVKFYEKVFGVKPQKMTDSYAKFDLKNPSLNFTMQSGPAFDKSRVNHLGIEVESADEVNQWQEKLSAAGLVKLVENNTDCCFARQDKVWMQDPDGNSWEIFYVHEQLPVEGELNKTQGSACCAPKIGTAKSSCC